MTPDSFGPSGRAPDEKDFRGGCALSEGAPVHIDRERMDKALAGPFYALPSGLTSEQIGAFVTAISQASEAGRRTAVEEAARIRAERKRLLVLDLLRELRAAPINSGSLHARLDATIADLEEHK